MNFFDRHGGLRRWLALLVAAALPSACATWQRVPGRGFLTVEQPREVRVSLMHGGQLVLYAPVEAGDELVGFRRAGDDASRISIPWSDVRWVEAQKLDVSRTGVVVGSVVVTAAILLIVASTEMSHAGGFPLKF